MRRQKTSWHKLWRAEKSWEELWKFEKSWDKLRWDEKRWEKLRWHEKRREQLRPAEKSWARDGRLEMGWDVMRWKMLTRGEMRWVEMRWDDTDCGDNGMQWAISKRSCDAMRSDEMRKDPTFKRHGMASDWQVKSLLLRSTEGLPVTYRHSPCSALHRLYISVSILKLPPPACPGTTCTTRLAQNTSQHYFVLQSFSVLLCITKLAQSTSQYVFVLQNLHSTFQYCFVAESLHKALPSTTLYYKACTKHFPVLLCAAKLAQSTFQCYFVLQSLHRVLPSTIFYYIACTKYFPVLLCTTKLAKSTSQKYFALQTLHKALPSTTMYYKACTSATLYYTGCTSVSQYSAHKAFTHQQAFIHSKLVHRDASTPRSFYTEKLLHTENGFRHWKLYSASFYAEKLLHESFYTQQISTHRKSYRSFTQSKLLHNEYFYTEKLSCTQWQQKLQLQNPSPTPKRKKNDFEALKKKTPAPKLRKSGARSLSQPSCSRSNTIHDSQLQKTMVLRSQPQQPGSLMQPLQCDLQRPTCKAQ